jgi:hypothetical protein
VINIDFISSIECPIDVSDWQTPLALIPASIRNALDPSFTKTLLPVDPEQSV